jgi:hypothetical protein
MFTQSVRPLHLRTPDDHAMVLHPAELGRVTIARRLASGAWREASVPVSDLPYAVRQFQGEHDVYLTQNCFFSRRPLGRPPRRAGRSLHRPRLLQDPARRRRPAPRPRPRDRDPGSGPDAGAHLCPRHRPRPRPDLASQSSAQSSPAALAGLPKSHPPDRRSFYALLDVPPINSAADAVRAAIVTDEKKRCAAYK